MIEYEVFAPLFGVYCVIKTEDGRKEIIAELDTPREAEELIEEIKKVGYDKWRKSNFMI